MVARTPIGKSRTLFKSTKALLAGVATVVIAVPGTLVGAPAASAQSCAGGVVNGHCIQGPMLTEYNAAATYNGYANGQAYFGNATGPAQSAADGGTFQAFEQHGYIYHHPTRSGGHANQIWGEIYQTWDSRSKEAGSLGYPRTRELNTALGSVNGQIGRFNEFENGWIYWSGLTGPKVIEPPIFSQYAAQGWEAGPLGFPTTDTLSNCGEHGASADAKAQAFEGEFLRAGTNKTFVFGQSNVVNIGGVPTLQIISDTSRYDNSVTWAIDAWNAAPSQVHLERVQLAIEPGAKPVRIVDSNRGDIFGAYGYYSGPSGGFGSLSSTIELFYNQIQSHNVDPDYVVTHEVGHALKLAHSCPTQLMAAAPQAGISTPQPLDVAVLKSLWG